MKFTLLPIVLIPFIISVGSMLFLNWGEAEKKNQLADIEYQLKRIGRMTDIDDVRREQMSKIEWIIDQYNENMTENEKMNVAGVIVDMGIKYSNLDINLICATISRESAWEPEIVSEKGAMGLMQIMPETGREISKYEGLEWTSAENVLYNPVTNIRIGSQYLSALIYDYEMKGGLAAYNGGMVKAEKWVQTDQENYRLLYSETRKYIPSVLDLYEKFQNKNIF